MTRLDIELVNRGLFETRSKSQNEIKNKVVFVNNKCIDKPSFNVNDSDKIEIIGETLKYVSRGGLKLEHAIKEFNIDLNNKIMIDIGSSTGGFSDCALQNNISKIYAIDVGSNQFSDKLKNNKKIFLYENTDFRNIDNNIVIDANICTIDVSFISVTKLLKKINELNLNEIICLIKPQFECGMDISNKYRGIPLNKEVHFEVINNVVNEFKKIDFYLNNITYSPIRGGNGNIEYLAYFVKNKKGNNINYHNIINEAFKIKE
ncbi:MAG: TlyA family RNA methyltransferase [Bacilli bacterium]|nr:TlyA family RNA methyltransferase [Bacilli bacterium]